MKIESPLSRLWLDIRGGPFRRHRRVVLPALLVARVHLIQHRLRDVVQFQVLQRESQLRLTNGRVRVKHVLGS